MIIKSANLLIRFLLELFMLAAFAYWGFKTGRVTVVKFGLGIGIPLLVAIVWGSFLSPKAPLYISEVIKLVLELIIFGLAAFAMKAAGHPAIAGALVLAFVINRILMYLWNQ
ncbi:MAG: YrdB family protein [Clostridium sp.]